MARLPIGLGWLALFPGHMALMAPGKLNAYKDVCRKRSRFRSHISAKDPDVLHRRHREAPSTPLGQIDVTPCDRRTHVEMTCDRKGRKRTFLYKGGELHFLGCLAVYPT